VRLIATQPKSYIQNTSGQGQRCHGMRWRWALCRYTPRRKVASTTGPQSWKYITPRIKVLQLTDKHYCQKTWVREAWSIPEQQGWRDEAVAEVESRKVEGEVVLYLEYFRKRNRTYRRSKWFNAHIEDGIRYQHPPLSGNRVVYKYSGGVPMVELICKSRCGMGGT